MKVLIVSTPFIQVPPPTYGGLERVVFDLAIGLCQLGMNVTIACPEESKLPQNIKHLNIGPTRYHFKQNWIQAEKEAFEKYESEMKDFDIIHDHTWLGWPYIAKTKNDTLKIIHTHHGHLTWSSPPPVLHPNLVGISNYMAGIYSSRLGVATRCVYNGIDLNQYPFYPNRGKHLMYLGRIVKFKQPHVAIDVAKRVGVPVDIVGGDQFVDDLSYVERVKKTCDGTSAQYIGEVTHDLKLKKIQECRAMIIPSNMGEPFGLVAVEALACGRPVICLNDGALKEIVQPSVGFVCETPYVMVNIIKNDLDLSISPEECRRRAEEFSKEKMASNYVKLYKDILQGNEW